MEAGPECSGELMLTSPELTCRFGVGLVKEQCVADTDTALSFSKFNFQLHH